MDPITAEQWAKTVEAIGCPTCQTISLTGTHICEHGVTTVDAVTVEFAATIEDPDLYRLITGLEP